MLVRVGVVKKLTKSFMRYGAFQSFLFFIHQFSQKIPTYPQNLFYPILRGKNSLQPLLFLEFHQILVKNDPFTFDEGIDSSLIW